MACGCVLSARAQSRHDGSVPGAAGEPYPHMPSIAPIGEKIGKYMELPAAAVGPAIDPAKGYRLQDLGDGLHMITDNVYQSMVLVYDEGVVVIDAPPSFARKFRRDCGAHRQRSRTWPHHAHRSSAAQSSQGRP
jgi:hypothetical protein